MAAPGSNLDRRLLLWISGAVLLLIVVGSVLAPTAANDDRRPSTYNTAPGGAKAAFLTLQALRRPVARWDRPLDDLRAVDAAHTTLVLAAPRYSALVKERLAAAVKEFLERGGRLVTTGSSGALLIPESSVQPSRRFGSLCYTEPEGPGPLAAAGKVEMEDEVAWTAAGPAARVEQRCGADAVVVRLPVGRGEAVWWSSASPMTNAELKNDPDLKLLLASLAAPGEPVRQVLFDESLQQAVGSQWSATRGLPLWWLLAQGALIFCLLVFSFSRRRGPVRLPVTVPRSSPVEFAVSMGDLYEKAGAKAAATEAARRRLARVLVLEAGLARQTVQGSPEAVVGELTKRFGGSWAEVGDHLREATAASGSEPTSRSALRLVQALSDDAGRVKGAAAPAPPTGAQEEVPGRKTLTGVG